mmetsp:Transcript_61398/g.121538  ORF Transcript_61398/g.121538 Transcript_61398/m.121538 type:complete len:233 (+) Transcript_61398:399-1097(+)
MPHCSRYGNPGHRRNNTACKLAKRSDVWQLQRPCSPNESSIPSVQLLRQPNHRRSFLKQVGVACFLTAACKCTVVYAAGSLLCTKSRGCGSTDFALQTRHINKITGTIIDPYPTNTRTDTSPYPPAAAVKHRSTPACFRYSSGTTEAFARSQHAATPRPVAWQHTMLKWMLQSWLEPKAPRKQAPPTFAALATQALIRVAAVGRSSAVALTTPIACPGVLRSWGTWAVPAAG